jgi:predicted PurR-regulated permease PerM
MDAAPTSRNDRIKRTIAVVLPLLLATECFVVLRPFLSALVWAIVICASTWPIYARVERILGGGRTVAAVMVTGAAATRTWLRR